MISSPRTTALMLTAALCVLVSCSEPLPAPQLAVDELAPDGSGPVQLRTVPDNSLPRTPIEDNPALDGWDSEVATNLAMEQLNQLSTLLLHPQQLTIQSLGAICGGEIQLGELRPRSWQSLFGMRWLPSVEAMSMGNLRVLPRRPSFAMSCSG